MNDSQFIAEELHRALRGDAQGDAWHGPSVSKVLQGVTAAMASARPIANAHSIWEITLHLAGWVGEVQKRLRGGEPGLPPDGDWPEQGEGDAAWERTLQALREAHENLIAEVEAFPDVRWDEFVGVRDAPLGTDVSLRAMVHGIVQHDAYHGGQIMILKKALESH
ncbi:MAG TPA: DinB family protein [Thermoanaerobaculia bacterium]|nr:DinB family protein [Thermoanaerobaculia bacterium]